MNISNSDFVFINCPFDEAYFDLLLSLLFTVIYLGKEPLISETKDSSDNRLTEIIKLMKQGKYSIHDLSRIEETRYNMPFELGIDYGLKYSEMFTDKTILILEAQKYSLKSVISDIAGSDPKCHNNNQQELIKCIRDWFFVNDNVDAIAYTEIYDAYYMFYKKLANDLHSKNIPVPLKIDTIPINEIIKNMKKYVENL